MDTLNTQVENALKNRDYQLVMHKASSSFARQLDVDTLQSCQMVALWKAIKNFDPTAVRRSSLTFISVCT